MAIRFPGVAFRVGWTIGPGVSGGLSFSLNSANAIMAHVRRMSVSGKLLKLRVRISSVTGSPSASDIVCRLYANSTSADAPGTAIGNEVSLSGTLSGAGYYDFDFSSQNIQLDKGSRYWFLMRNANASPGVNYVNAYYGDGTSTDISNAGSLWASSYTSSDGGSTWTSTSNRWCHLVVTDNGAEGLLYSMLGNSLDSVSTTTYAGVQFTTPPNRRMNVVAVAMHVSSNPAGKFMIFGVPNGPVSTGTFGYGVDRIAVGHFSSPVTLEPNTTYRVVAATTSGTMSLNGSPIDNSLENLSVLPFNSRYTRSADSGSSWTEYTDKYPSVWVLILDNDNPFEIVGGSGGSPIINPFQIIT